MQRRQRGRWQLLLLVVVHAAAVHGTRAQAESAGAKAAAEAAGWRQWFGQPLQPQQPQQAQQPVWQQGLPVNAGQPLTVTVNPQPPQPTVVRPPAPRQPLPRGFSLPGQAKSTGGDAVFVTEDLGDGISSTDIVTASPGSTTTVEVLPSPGGAGGGRPSAGSRQQVNIIAITPDSSSSSTGAGATGWGSAAAPAAGSNAVRWPSTQQQQQQWQGQAPAAWQQQQQPSVGRQQQPVTGAFVGGGSTKQWGSSTMPQPQQQPGMQQWPGMQQPGMLQPGMLQQPRVDNSMMPAGQQAAGEVPAPPADLVSSTVVTPAQPPPKQQPLKKNQGKKSKPGAKPCGCPGLNFACGTDGRTYANRCLAECVGVRVLYLGPCEARMGTDASSSDDDDGTSSPVPAAGAGAGAGQQQQGSGWGPGAAEDNQGDSSALVMPPVPAPRPTPAKQPKAPPKKQQQMPPPPLVDNAAAGGVQDGDALSPQPAGGWAALPPMPPPQRPAPQRPGMQQPVGPAPLPVVLGPEPIPTEVSDVPVPPPLPIMLSSPRPPVDNKGQAKPPRQQPASGVPPLAPPPPAPAGTGVGAGGALLKPATGLPQPGQPQQPLQLGPPIQQASNVTAPAPWVFKQPGADDTILIGCILPFEGDLQLTGTAIYHALKMAVADEAPKALPGVNVNLTCINTRCQDIASHRAMTQLADERAVAVVGEVCSAATVAAAGVATTAQIPLISPAATTPSLSDKDMFFRTVPSDKFQGQAGADLAYKKGFRNVAMVYEDAAYGWGLAFNFIAAFTKNGGNVPVVIPFRKGEGNPQQAVQQLKADKAGKSLDTVFLSTNNLTYAAEFLKAASAADLGLRVFGGDALVDTGLAVRLTGVPSAIGNLSITATNKGKNSFIKRFKQQNPTVAYQGFAAQAYDAMVALLRAYAAASPPRTGPEIAQQLLQQKFEGVSGPVEFDERGDVLPHERTYMWVKHNLTTGVPDVKGFVAKELGAPGGF